MSYYFNKKITGRFEEVTQRVTDALSRAGKVEVSAVEPVASTRWIRMADQKSFLSWNAGYYWAVSRHNRFPFAEQDSYVIAKIRHWLGATANAIYSNCK